ncbi:unnamed protein product [Clavelina lepadiformis]|uniref:Uncharacterized protein n=1 Tax=Clavelina lepadiformis TaxID=159417 RepID=A0ABP0GS85_CLALP
MNRYDMLLAAGVLIVTVISSPTADACGDLLAACPRYAGFCKTSTVESYCMKTCGLCSVDTTFRNIANQCLINNGGCNHLCTWTGQEAVCSCLPGFRLEINGKTCLDIDECQEAPNPCSAELPAYCVNTIGSYSCEAYKCSEPGTMNYYRSGECCQVKNSTCGITATIRKQLESMSALPAHGVAQRIFGGSFSSLSSWPWMAQILLRGNSHCGATLIANRWLISAAHCFSDPFYDTTMMTVYLGHVRSAHLNEVDTSVRVQRRIARVFVHHEYDVHQNDIALIELNQTVEFNDAISPICLPCGEVPQEGDKCWATGFGRTERSGRNAAPALKEVDVPIAPFDECRENYKTIEDLHPNRMLCAGYKAGGKDACVGDSGGPLACQRKDSCEWYLSGVTSFGRNCGEAKFYGVYTNVVNYEAWIRQTMGEDSENLCQKIYNPCSAYTNNDGDCYFKLDRCSKYPVYMKQNCKLACCQLENHEISDCVDNPDTVGVCDLNKRECNNPVVKSFMTTNCKKTCGFC